MPPPALVARLNEQWRNGEPSGELSRAGILVHTFDNTEDDMTAKQSVGKSPQDAEPWRPCSAQAWCGQYHGRLSASIINQAQRVLFTSEFGAGIVLSPGTSLYCSYPVDGGTMQKFCPPGAPTGCAPGCATETGEPNWCDHDEAWSPLTSAQVWSCAFRPDDLEAMLRHHRNSRASQYNEVVVDTSSYETHLPNSLLAFFFLASDRGGGSERKARDAQARFLRRYRGAMTPVVSLDVDAADGNAWRLES